MSAKKQRELVEFVVGKLWAKNKASVIARATAVDGDLAFEVMRRMKRRGWLMELWWSMTFGKWAVGFRPYRGGRRHAGFDANPIVAVLVSARQVLSK